MAEYCRVLGAKTQVTWTIEQLVEEDLCFGKRFAKTSEACGRCEAPLLVDDERIVLFNQLCAEVCGQGGPITGRRPLNRLSSTEVQARLNTGASYFEIWTEILAGEDPEFWGVEARKVLDKRIRYLRSNLSKEEGYEALPNLPTTAELIKMANEETP